MLTFTLILEPFWNTRLSYQPAWCKTFLRKREKEVFFLPTLKISLTPTLQDGPFQVMFLGTEQQKKQNKLNTHEREGQDATKITSAPAESCNQFLWSVMPISMTARTWMVRNIPNRNTIKAFTEEIDETELVIQYNSSHVLMRMLCLCLALMNLLLHVATLSSSLVTMAITIPHWVVTSDFFSQVGDRPVWISFRVFLLPLDIWAIRTAGPKWNDAKLYGSFAALLFFFMEKDESEKREPEPLPEGPSLCCNLCQGFG